LNIQTRVYDSHSLFAEQIDAIDPTCFRPATITAANPAALMTDKALTDLQSALDKHFPGKYVVGTYDVAIFTRSSLEEFDHPQPVDALTDY
jgi:hypothetical protein